MTTVQIWGYRESMSTERAERMDAERQLWERLRVSSLHLVEVDGRWRLVAVEPVAIADQDPELWGDQA
jgi:hypothetical protein